ncbi:class I SAM-dependent methyltransferase [Chryseobacterium sp. WG14]|uniref:class I SAM-dependent methyltransferase n=1 Tax=unclassified Chryseobacterium TaxID=2593645 RepID=UPI001D406725|nr:MULTISPECIES: class I SAM-dependent methyltransferase [unclassified Chryseobacterium]MCQ9637359.1 class I SAM-dependent methyltransferase [Chryseobacterium sp. WG23]MCQ9639543.1 class I SAM-dependent methyltransferase [Chryseobacterium sp. WG14]CAH0205277.1 23S rRNA (uracil(1939)-C(5))-methyltransferase RlmD [Chryseobacterium sp. Bi04]
MIFNDLKLNIDVKDSTFNELYPSHIKELASRHWTPIAVAKIAAEYLAQKPDTKILDIGAGVGKFCLVGAASTKGMFFGVEQRASLTKISKKIASRNKIDNVEFIHANINEISFLDYDAFYFFNSFYENIDTTCLIDNTVMPEKDLYYAYSDYVKEQLDKTPVGTRLVTYWSKWDEIPSSFDIVGTDCNGLLNFWKKTV